MWLHELGFSRVHHHKGVYFDRRDVVDDRMKFLAKMEELDKKSIKFDEKLSELSSGEKPLATNTCGGSFHIISTTFLHDPLVFRSNLVILQYNKLWCNVTVY